MVAILLESENKDKNNKIDFFTSGDQREESKKDQIKEIKRETV